MAKVQVQARAADPESFLRSTEMNPVFTDTFDGEGSLSGPRKGAVLAMLATLALSLLLSGCGKTDASALKPATEVLPVAPAQASKPVESEAVQPLALKIDGMMDDWGDSTLLFDDVGAVVNDPGFSIDVKQVYVTNDRDSIFLFLCCTPTVVKRFKEHPITGGFVDLFFDLDNDRDTGSTDAEVDAFGYGVGFEMKAKIKMGMRGAKEIHRPTVEQSLRKFDTAGTEKVFDPSLLAPQVIMQERHDLIWRDIQGGEHSSDAAGARIAHGPEGVEIAIPIRYLNVGTGANIRIMIAEDANEFKVEGYSVSTYTMK